MGIYLKIGGTDVSRFITANRYSAVTTPVYDEESTFINIYGEKIRPRTGHEVTVSAVLTDVDDVTAAALSDTLSAGSCTVTYSAPAEKSAAFECEKLALALDRVYRGVKYWTAELILHASFVPEDGL